METKRVFSIQINGLTETSDAVKSLNERLDTLADKLKALNNTKVNISVNDNTSSKVVSSKGGSNPLEKLTLALEKEKTKQTALQNDEYREQLQLLEQIKQENKQIAQGAKDIDGNYTDTLAGLKAELSDIKKALNNEAIGSDMFNDLVAKAGILTDKIKAIEEQTGNFSRNVGNYAGAIEEVLDSSTFLFEQNTNTMKGLKQTIADITKELEDTDIKQSPEEWNRLANELAGYKEQLKQMTDASREGGRATNEMSRSIETSIGNFDSAKAAIKALEKELLNMAANGEQSTERFKTASQELVKLREGYQALNQTLKDSMYNMGGLNDALSMVKGFTSIAGIGQGFASLFGGGEELNKTVQKMASMMLILQSVAALQKEAAQQTSAFGKVLALSAASMSGFTKRLRESSEEEQKMIDLLTEDDKLKNIAKRYDELNEVFNKQVRSVKEVADAYAKLDEAEKRTVEEIFPIYGVFAKSDNAEEYINQVQIAASVNQDLENTYNNLQKAAQDFSESFEKVEQLTTEVPNGIKLLNRGMSGTQKVFLSLKIAAKQLMASLIEFLPVLLLIAAAFAAFKGVEKIFDLIKNGTDKSQKSAEALTATLTAQKAAWEKINKELEHNLKMQDASQYVSMAKKIEQLNKQLEELNKTSNKYFESLGKGKTIMESTGKSLEEFRKEYERLMDIQITDKNRFWRWLVPGDDLKRAQKRVIKDMLSQLEGLSESDAVKKVKELMGDEMYASAFANIDNLWKDKTWVKSVKELIEGYQDLAESIEDTTNSLEELRAAAEKTITGNNIAAIRDQFARQRAELENSLKEELKDAEGNEELKASIRAKYAQKRIEMEKQIAATIRGIDNTIANNYVAAMDDGLKKQLKQLELQEKEEIAQARDSEIKVQEQIDSIVAKYAKMRADLYRDNNKTVFENEREWLRKREDLYKDYYRAIADIEREIAELQADAMSFNIDFDSEKARNVALYDAVPIEDYRTYYQQILDLETEFNRRREEQAVNEAKRLSEIEVENEHRRLSDRLQEITRGYEDNIKAEEEALKQGIITVEEFNKRKAQLTTAYNDQMANEQSVSEEKTKEIVKKGENDVTKIMLDSFKERQDNMANYVDKIVGLTSQMLSRVEREYSKTMNNSTNAMGWIDYSDYKSALEQRVEGYKTVKKEIERSIDELNQKFANHLIDKEQFDSLSRELEDALDDANNAIKQGANELANSLSTWSSMIISNFVMPYMQVISTMVNTVTEMIDRSIDNQEAAIEKQKDMLDEQIDTLEDQYRKMEEIVKRYTDNINSIEDELADARGDRREALIDDLAKQRDAQLKAIQAEKKAEMEKEKLEKKKQALEKKQDELELKRKKAQKAQNITQAIISTLTGATQALAIPPAPVGIALAAVITALGMANVAQIAAQKFANGGLLSGPSHSQGGIPVGNTGMEVEGNEFVVNKKTTMQNLPLMEFINSKKKVITMDDIVEFYSGGRQMVNSSFKTKFAEGGQLPQMQGQTGNKVMRVASDDDNRTYVVSVVDIVNASERLKDVEVLAGIN